MTSTILQLSQLISNAIADLVKFTSENNLCIPDLNDRFTPESEGFRKHPNVAKSANIIAAAAFQLAACVLPPQESVIQMFSGHYKSAALRVSIECHVAEILRDGLHVNEIAMRTGVDGVKLARMLRLLANRHIFREVQPDFFANNRISGVLDTGNSIDEILRDPTKKHDGTSGFVAIVETNVSGGHKASAYILENMKDPLTAFSPESHHAPFQRSHHTTKNFFDWYTEPEQVYERHRFGIAMKGSTAMIPPNLLLELYDWGTLSKGALVVDVGGGIGSSCRTILRAHPDLRCIIQDLPAVIADGIKHWEKEAPDALTSGHMVFQAHDFFTPQPITDASVFLMKSVLHDWSDPYAMKILINLRNSAKLDTILLICDIIMTPSCREPQPSGTDDYVIIRDPLLEAPEILSTGFNSVNDMVWTLDIAMLTLVNTQERTLAQFKQLLAGCGWRITKVVRKGSSLDSIQAVAV